LTNTPLPIIISGSSIVVIIYNYTYTYYKALTIEKYLLLKVKYFTDFMAEILTVALTSYTDAEREQIRKLKAERQLSKVVSIALHQYLLNVNPDLAAAEEKNIELKDDADLEKVETYYREYKPQATKYEIKSMYDFLGKKIKECQDKNRVLIFNTVTCVWHIKEKEEKATT